MFHTHFNGSEHCLNIEDVKFLRLPFCWETQIQVFLQKKLCQFHLMNYLKAIYFEKLEMSSFQLQDSKEEQSQAKPLKCFINEPYKHKFWKKSDNFKQSEIIVWKHWCINKYYLQNV